MEHIHSGLTVSTEDNADRFFMGILGLEKLASKTLARGVAKAIFGLDTDLLVLQYRSGTVHYEVFVVQGFKAPEGQLAHSCLKLADLEGVLRRCRQGGAKVITAEKASGVVTFVSDYDGNLFELKAY